MEQRNGGWYDPQAKRGDFRIMIAPCNVTGEVGKVITTLANTVDFTLEDGTEDSMQVWVSYSAEGLQQMARALAEAPFPVEIPTDGAIRANLKYYWKAVYPDGTEVNQWTPKGEERHFGHILPHRVQRFFLLPKDKMSGWPAYCLDREEGLLRRARPGGDFEPLLDPVTREKLPFPTVPFHLEWCFTPTVTLAFGCGQHEVFPERVRHELGWRLDTLHGDPTDVWFTIAIDDDGGEWQIHRKEPLNSRWFTGEEPEPKVIEGDVRIIDAFVGGTI